MERKENLCQPPEYPAEMFSEYIESAKARALRASEIEAILGDDYDLDRLKKLVELTKNIPHVCRFCVGCEMEPKDGHGCDEYDSFVFSTRRLRELMEADREGRCVPIVRCRECIHYKPQSKSAKWNCTTLFCNRTATIKMDPDDFCSRGKRSTDNSTEK